LGGRSSTGIELGKLFRFLESQKLDFYVLTLNTDIQDPRVLTISPKKIWLSNFLKKLIFIVVGIDLDTRFSGHKLKTVIQQIDLVERQIVLHGFTSSTDLYVLALFRNISMQYGVNFNEKRMHFFDPLPAKAHWGEHVLFRDAKIKWVSKFLEVGMELSAASTAMCEYLKNVYGKPFHLKYSKVEEQPIKFQNSGNAAKKKAYFLGSIYGMRSGNAMIQAFENLDQWELHIYGDNPVTARNNVRFYPYVKDIEKLGAPDLLIDLDVEVPDVYIPGKSYTYLKTEIPILAICQEESALRSFYQLDTTSGNVPTVSNTGIYWVENQTESIKNALLEISNSTVNLNRANLREQINQFYFGRDFR
jgi:hypothetical protein